MSEPLTIEALAALPVGAEVVDRDGDLWVKNDKPRQCWSAFSDLGSLLFRLNVRDLTRSYGPITEAKP